MPRDAASVATSIEAGTRYKQIHTGVDICRDAARQSVRRPDRLARSEAKRGEFPGKTDARSRRGQNAEPRQLVTLGHGGSAIDACGSEWAGRFIGCASELTLVMAAAKRP